MSFSTDVKDEIIQSSVDRSCCKEAHLVMIRHLAEYSQQNAVLFRTRSAAYARYLLRSLKACFGSDFTVKVLRSRHQRKRPGYTLICPMNARMPNTLTSVWDWQSLEGLLSLDCCKTVLLKHIFLVFGTISAPERDYQFEIFVQDAQIADCTWNLCETLLSKPLRRIQRQNGILLYTKSADMLVELCSLMGASRAMMSLENLRILKDVKNQTNRIVNCDTANLDKVLLSALKSLEAIRTLRSRGQLNTLSEPLRKAVALREEFPEASLAELAEHAGNVSKSTLNRRFQKLIALCNSV